MSMEYKFFYIISILNAINLIDGLDGLAGGVSVIITMTFIGLSILSGMKILEIYPLIILVGSLLGFLLHNKPPAKTFLGDTGSLFLGWFFAIYSLIYAQKTTFSLSISIPVTENPSFPNARSKGNPTYPNPIILI